MFVRWIVCESTELILDCFRQCGIGNYRILSFFIGKVGIKVGNIEDRFLEKKRNLNYRLYIKNIRKFAYNAGFKGWLNFLRQETKRMRSQYQDTTKHQKRCYSPIPVNIFRKEWMSLYLLASVCTKTSRRISIK